MPIRLKTTRRRAALLPALAALALAALLAACGLATPPSKLSEREALIALYNANDGPNWTDNTNWLSDKPIGEWHGVTTDHNGQVVRLNLADNRLSGRIPAALGDLSNLEGLYLHGNRLSGRIPWALGDLSNLEWLRLNNNELSGEIPAALGKLGSLRMLNLADNQLSGRIPVMLANFNKPDVLFLAGNRLRGCVRASLRSVPTNDFDRLGLPFC